MQCFVTVGTTTFSELVHSATSADLQKSLLLAGFTRLVVQHGTAPYPDGIPKTNLQIVHYSIKPSIAQDMQDSDLIVSHCGAGTVMEALDRSKRVVVVVNPKLMDNHQQELADALNDHVWCSTPASLLHDIDEIYRTTHTKLPFPKGDTTGFRNCFEQLLKKC